jgi:hypothetical protein
MVFISKKNEEVDRLEESKPWEKTHGWTNPFGDEEEEERIQRQRQEERKLRKKKKKRSSRRHHMTDEEYSTLSSKADSLLDDLLGEDDETFNGGAMPRLREGSFELGATTNNAHRGAATNPFEEAEEEEEDLGGDEINQEEFSALMRGATPAKTNPYVAQELEEDDESTILPPPPKVNPFEDETVADSEPVMNGGAVHKNSSSADDLMRKPTDTTGESDSESPVNDDEEDEDDADDESEEDVVTSSKRLLRMADERLQYQQYNDEIKKLRESVDRMKHQAEAMSEQLRRAVETKCDLVLAQTEMERCHEQNLISKDDEIRDIKRYTQELVDYSANNELNFMNEISCLSKRMEDMAAAHKSEMAAKDSIIAELQAKLQSMQASVHDSLDRQPIMTGMSVESFRARFLTTPEGSVRAPIACL